MHIFKLTPKPQSDYRLEVKEIKQKCKLEKHGYRHNKIVYGFSENLDDIEGLQTLGLNIEEITFDEAQLALSTALAERARAKSKIDHILHDREFNGAENADQEAMAQQKLTDLNDTIQETKTSLGINGTVKALKF
ncbi:hypothetical protein MTBPR1_100200 [Candidatus Terasakiella magnetica]|uniref:Uncharacterized protein n=1 Tax=Candidatus Terasakiella magnetica TaxID=1867952 RepID=A0A1C3RE63_9PROT|nr:hypothetical protein [Candidatus Terasakiella magnetica]SCA55559.1 hypothetical protein MTBPR1_100200 [Candidatus Terasakiella magnetica]